MAGYDEFSHSKQQSTNIEDDRTAVLRQLSAQQDQPPMEETIKPRLSPKTVIIVLGFLSAITLIVWAPWNTPSPATPVPTKENAQPKPRDANGTSGASTDDTQTSSTEDDENGEVIVHVVGRVKKPGLITLEEGARVADAIEAAGGVTKTADLTRINLARVLHDEEHLVILNSDEDPPEREGAQLEGGSHANGNGNDHGSDDVLNLNTADQSALEGLPGVGPVMADRIIAWREENGPFSSVEDLHEISGVGPKIFAQLEPLVTV